MGLFSNIFQCFCHNDNKNDEMKDTMIVIRTEIKKLESDINLLFRVKSSAQTVGRLEDKMNNQFQLLSNKIDNVIMILNTRQQ